MKVAAIVPSAGRGRRLKSRIEKPFVKLGDKSILAHTLIRLSKSKYINEIVVSVARDKIDKAKREIVDKYCLRKVKLVAGGKERKDSVFNALKNISSGIDYVLIHDGIRPFITNKFITSLLKAAFRFRASILAVPVKPTLKFSQKGQFIKYTPDREYYWEAQTPQVFRRDLIEKAYRQAGKKKVKATDDSMLVEMMGVKPKIVMGSYSNIKITTEEDLALAKILIMK